MFFENLLKDDDMVQRKRSVDIRSTGNLPKVTMTYETYERSWDLCSPGKPVLHYSNKPLLGSDPSLYNLENMQIAALSSCDMLSYLNLDSNYGTNDISYQWTAIVKGETIGQWW